MLTAIKHNYLGQNWIEGKKVEIGAMFADFFFHVVGGVFQPLSMVPPLETIKTPNRTKRNVREGG